MHTRKTLGQLSDEGQPICEAFDLLRQLAEQRGWIPIGFRRFELPDGFVVTVNGTSEPRTDLTDEGTPGIEVPPYHASAWHEGWPLGLFNPFDGVLLAGAEDRLIAALRAALTKGQTR